MLNCFKRVHVQMLMGLESLPIAGVGLEIAQQRHEPSCGLVRTPLAVSDALAGSKESLPCISSQLGPQIVP